MHLNARFAHGTPAEIEQSSPPPTKFPARASFPPLDKRLTPILALGLGRRRRT